MPIVITLIVLAIFALTSCTSPSNEDYIQQKPVSIIKWENLHYAKHIHQRLTLDIYRPDNSITYPGIILVHGGGWVGGSRKAFTDMAKDMAKRGYVVANIDYRLAGDAKFPAAVNDTKAAIIWLKSNAERYNLDPSVVGGIGASAGGHLIAMAALTAEETNDASLQAYVIMGSGVDQVERAKTTEVKRHKNAILFFGGTLAQIPEIYKQGSPINHVSPAAPPVLMLDGGKDRPGARYAGFAKRLMENSIEHEFQIIENAKHAQWITPQFQAQYIEAFDSFMLKHLKPSSKLMDEETPQRKRAPK